VESWLQLQILKQLHKLDIHGMKEKLGQNFKFQMFQFMLIILLWNQKLHQYNLLYTGLMKKTLMNHMKMMTMNKNHY